ncbi:ABC-F family ATP-binding cassette domain-containing protein [Mobilicoccus caccae]|uniref:ABC transporter ATP-binding protein n=1 Tax=Mobilicoccus caccae TaxID=1859295 RepID=A0ABQ6IWW4_9MICO|nr:ABC-F family ATP-binding cassette domain-containing protein [Mobilicoccus caccae]GMA41189.1 ABC transporter ATP-binding protein [Mobilicoccus caccae]
MSVLIDHLALEGIDRRYPDRTVLRDVGLTVPPGERVALVGENGAGKSTLLRVAAGLDTPDAGTVVRPGSLRLVQQELPFPDDATITDVLDAATAQARAVEARLMATTSDLAVLNPASAEGRRAADRYDEALTEADLTDVWSVGSRVDRAVEGLGLGHLPRDRVVGALSGGQRSRLALAGALVAGPVALLLDEPTNHLDADGIAFLADELRGRRGPLLFATHDRGFIDAVATKVVDLDPAVGPHRAGEDRDLVGVQGTTYRGGYTDFLASRAAERDRWVERYEREQARLTELRHEVNVGARDVMHTTQPRSEARASKKFYADRAATTIARRVRSARARVEELECDQVAKPPNLLRFSGFQARPARGRGAADIVADLVDVAVHHRLALTSLTVGGRDRVLVTGPNGCGKSTLLHVLTGDLAPEVGTRRTAHGLRIGMLTQDVTWAYPQRSTLATVATATRLEEDDAAERLAASGLVARRDLHREVGRLSVGQQRRVALAILVLDPPDLLVLDEPTNHLSLPLSEALEEAIPDHPGAVVVASHDRWIGERWTGRRLDLGT